MPFDVAVEEPDAWVVGAEAQDEVAVWADEDGVAAHWDGVLRGGRRGRGVVGTCFCVAADEDLEGVAVEVEGVSFWVLLDVFVFREGGRRRRTYFPGSMLFRMISTTWFWARMKALVLLP